MRVVGAHGGADVHDVEPRAIAAPKPATLLAALVARRGRVVTTDRLVDELWAGPRPRRARPTVHVYVSRLRAFLDPAGGGPGPIATCAGGYVLRHDDGGLDAQDFLDLVERGREDVRAGHHHEGARVLAGALELWRGNPYEGVAHGPIVRAHRARLDAARLDCLELLVETRLDLGRYRESVALLYSLTAEYPLHEAFARHLMIALYRCGRRADALTVYRDTCGALRELLGLEPCGPLRATHHAVLAGAELPRGRTDSLAR